MKAARRFEDFPPYTPIEPFEVLSDRLGIPIEKIVKLDANENPYGMSPRARKALEQVSFAHIYPDPESRALRKALSAFTGVPEQYLMAGAGADELIDLVLRVLLEPGDCVVNCPPTFGMYPFDTLLNAGQVVNVARREDFSLDLDGVLAAVRNRKPKAIFLTAPNNPDGRFPSRKEVETLLAQDLLVVIDEAYIEFVSDGGRLGEKRSRIQDVVKQGNLAVLRTFSKWAGLAGLRVGYGAFPSWLLEAMWKAKQPYNVNVAATAAALGSLQDLDERVATVARLRCERKRLFEMLERIPYLKPYPSEANFILCRVLDRPAKHLKEQLAGRGVLVRYYDNELLRGFVRASVGRAEDTDALEMVLREAGGFR